MQKKKKPLLSCQPDAGMLKSVMASKNIKKPTSGQNNWYLFDGNNLIDYGNNCPCFGDIANDSTPSGAEFFVAANRSYGYHKNFEIGDVLRREYLSWLYYESQFSPLLSYNDLDWCLRQSAVVVSGYMPSNLAVFLAQLNRLAYGYMSVVHSWNILRKIVHPNVAIVLAHFFPCFVQHGEYLSDLSFSPASDEHYPICARHLTRSGFLRAISCYPVRKNLNKDFVCDPYYKGIDNLWKKKEEQVLYSPFAEDGKTPNPFIRPESPSADKVSKIHRWIAYNHLEEIL